jgi:hypothetical protein
MSACRQGKQQRPSAQMHAAADRKILCPSYVLAASSTMIRIYCIILNKFGLCHTHPTSATLHIIASATAS